MSFFFIDNILCVYHHHHNVLTGQILLTLSLTIHPYQPSLLASLLVYIQCPHKADECKFLLVEHH